MTFLTVGIFCAVLLTCVLLDLPILCALAFGLVLFLGYGRYRRLPWRELFLAALEGVKTIRHILLTFLLIGILTAFWRAAGTIPVIVSAAAKLIRPSVFLLMTFLLNCGVSLLMGTSFGTSATMGVICAMMASSMGIDPVPVGGAVLAGAFFGDRCSPVSTSALLVSGLTETNIFDNIRRMFRSAPVPFFLSCIIYALLGLRCSGAETAPDLSSIFSREFSLLWPAVIPAAVILVLSAFRIRVKAAMAASIITAIPLCLFLQHIAPLDLIKIAVVGYRAKDAALSAMIDGGGLVSMLKVSGIVCLSSSYSGLFKKTELLGGAKQFIESLARKTTPFTSILVTSVISSMIACNQTLAAMLTAQLCDGLGEDASAFALDLEDTVIVLSPLVPWSIAGSMPLSLIGAPAGAIAYACYLYLLPLWRLICSFVKKKKTGAGSPTPAAS